MGTEELMVCDNCGVKEPTSAHEHGWVRIDGALLVCGKAVFVSGSKIALPQYSSMYGGSFNGLLQKNIDFCSIDCMLKKIDSIMHPKPEH
jgi:hypothetical protein